MIWYVNLIITSHHSMIWYVCLIITSHHSMIWYVSLIITSHHSMIWYVSLIITSHHSMIWYVCLIITSHHSMIWYVCLIITSHHSMIGYVCLIITSHHSMIWYVSMAPESDPVLHTGYWKSDAIAWMNIFLFLSRPRNLLELGAHRQLSLSYPSLFCPSHDAFWLEQQEWLFLFLNTLHASWGSSFLPGVHLTCTKMVFSGYIPSLVSNIPPPSLAIWLLTAFLMQSQTHFLHCHPGCEVF